MRSLLTHIGRRRGAAAVVVTSLVFAAPALADQLINESVIVQGGTCIGVDCVNGQDFAGAAVTLKENNLRIEFDDRSDGLAGPTDADWTLIANDSANAGAAFLGIGQPTARPAIDGEPTAHRIAFKVMAGGLEDALVIGATGPRLGHGGLVESVNPVSTENVSPVDPEAVKAGLSGLAIHAYETTGLRHIGPLSAEFNSALGIGNHPGAAFSDMAGVALAVLKDAAPRAAAATPGGTGPQGLAGPQGAKGQPGEPGPPAAEPGKDHRPSTRQLARLNRKIKKLSRSQSALKRRHKSLGKRISRTTRAARKAAR